MTNITPVKHIGIAIDLDQLERLREIAKAERRDLASKIRHMIDLEVTRHEERAA